MMVMGLLTKVMTRMIMIAMMLVMMMTITIAMVLMKGLTAIVAAWAHRPNSRSCRAGVTVAVAVFVISVY